MKQVFIQISPDPDQPAKWLIQDKKSIRSQTGLGPISALAPLIHGHQVILLIPGEHVSLLSTKLQISQSSKLRKAIPYALEEQLSEDVENLHFAYNKVKDGLVNVAIINKERLQHWITQLESEGISPRYIIADTQALPWSPETWSILIQENRAIVRTGAAEGFVTEREGLESLLTAIADTHPLPTSTSVWYCDQDTTPLRWSDSAPPVETKPCLGGALDAIADNWQPQLSINFLQGSFGADLNLAKHLKPWKWAAAALVIWLGLLTATQIIEKQQLQAKVNETKEKMVNIYRQTFPQARKIPNPRVQMAQKLKQLKGDVGQSDSDFLTLLSASADIISSSKATTLESINYRREKATLQFSAKSLGELEQLKEKINALEGINAELAGADSSPGKASGQIRVSAQ